MDITKRIKLDFMCPPYPIVVYAKQGDSGTRFIEVEPLAYGEKYTIPTGISAKLACKKPDGSYLVNNTLTITDNIIKIPLTQHMLDKSGSAQCAVVLFEVESDKILTTQNFTLSIEKTPYSDVPDAEDLPEYTVVSFPKPDSGDDKKMITIIDNKFVLEKPENVIDLDKFSQISNIISLLDEHLEMISNLSDSINENVSEISYLNDKIESIISDSSNIHTFTMRSLTENDYNDDGTLKDEIKNDIINFYNEVKASVEDDKGDINTSVYLRYNNIYYPAIFRCTGLQFYAYAIDYEDNNFGTCAFGISYSTIDDKADMFVNERIGDQGEWITWIDDDTGKYVHSLDEMIIRGNSLASDALVGHALKRGMTELREEISQIDNKVGTIPSGGEASYDSVIDYVNKITAGIATSGAMEGLANRVGIIESNYVTEDELNSIKEEIKNEVVADASNVFVIESPNKNYDGTYSSTTIQAYRTLFEEIFNAVNPIIMYKSSDGIYPAYLTRQNITVGEPIYIYTLTAYNINAEDKGHHTYGTKIVLEAAGGDSGGELTVTAINNSIGDDGDGKVYDYETYEAIQGGYKNLEFDLEPSTNHAVYSAIEGAFDMEFIFDGGTAEDVMDVE